MKKVALSLYTILTVGVLPAATGYYQHNLVADVAGVADFTDPNLVNAWGLATSAASPFWVCDGGTGLSTIYSASNTPGAALGTPNATTKPTVPGAGGAAGGVCTGIIANTATTSFNISTTANPTPRPSSFIFVTEDGVLSAWANAVDPAHAVLVVDNSSSAVYKGLALVATPTPQLYAANFRAGTIDVFDAAFKPVTLAAGAFTDPAVTVGFAPFNIWNLGGKLYVTYAKQDAAKKFDVPGTGNGFVSVYDPAGKLLQHLTSNGPLNSPWGVAIAPAAFGKFANAVLVGNFGDGLINAFDATTGALLGPLQDGAGKNIVIPGLWALLVGNGGNGGDKESVFFTAGPGGQKHGLLGSIQANPTLAAATITNAAQAGGGVAGNTFVAIKGANLAATKRAWQTADFASNSLPSTIDGVTVTVGGKPAYIAFISPAQINVITPVDLANSGNVDVIVTNNGLTSNTASVAAQALAPTFFLINSDKYVAATHSDNKSIIGPPTLIANTTTPAASGETIVLYGNGFGQTTPAITNGQLVPSARPLAGTATVLVNNVAANVVFAGLVAPGLYQLNVTLPAGLPDGDLPIVARIGGVSSPAGALITIKN
ncbi:MAG: TIGR03118 family protein [Bryobacteraceae bacterium]